MAIRAIPSPLIVRTLLALTWLMGSVACSSTGSGEEDSDAGVRQGPYDECGNGMDDDVDGLIDEGCPCGGGEVQSCFTGAYPNRLVGGCMDGTQICDAPFEFGEWGQCTGDTLPAEELCDGSLDDDCDGAVDEGCECPVGETRGCGEASLPAPCQGGVQTCHSDGWSPCEGAVGPSAEVCDDEADNDCDGDINEGCECVPGAEVCDDGIDNDCDGSIDEPACRAAPTDAGVSMDSSTDAGRDAPARCECEASEFVWSRSLPADLASLALSPSSDPFSVWTGDDYIVAYVAGANGTSAHDVYLTRFDSTGMFLGTRPVASLPASENSIFHVVTGLQWTGHHLILGYRSASQGFVQRFEREGEPIGEPVLVSANARIAWSGTELGVLETDASNDDLATQWVDFAMVMTTYDGDLNETSSRLPIAAVEAGVRNTLVPFSKSTLVWIGDRWLVTWIQQVLDTPINTMSARGPEYAHVSVVRSGAVVADHVYPANTNTSIALVSDGMSGALACRTRVVNEEQRLNDMVCQRFDAEGMPGLEMNLGTAHWSSAPGLVRWGCAYVLLSSKVHTDGVSVFDETTVRVLEDGSSSFVEAPLPALSMRLTGSEYFTPFSWGTLMSSPGSVVIQGRGRISGTGDTHPTSVRLGCR